MAAGSGAMRWGTTAVTRRAQGRGSVHLSGGFVASWNLSSNLPVAANAVSRQRKEADLQLPRPGEV